MLTLEIKGTFISLKWVELVHKGEFRYGSQWCFMGISGWAFARVWVYNTTPKAGFISDLSVIREKQNMGIGTGMLESIEIYCRAKGLESLSLQVYEDAERTKDFYIKRGYHEISRSPGYIEMTKAL